MNLGPRSSCGIFKCFNPLLQAKRFRAKVNVQRPKPPHFERAKYVALTKPYFLNPNKNKTVQVLCGKLTDGVKEEVENPYQQIIAQELQYRFNNSRLVAFYHANPMKGDQHFKAFAMFKKENMYYKNYGKKTLQLAVNGTKFEPVLDFYVSQNITVFSPEPELKKLLAITKKFPRLILLAAIFEGKFVSKDDIIELSLIPNLQVAQASLCQTLNSVAGTLSTQLNAHQITLVSQLQERIKQLEEK